MNDIPVTGRIMIVDDTAQNLQFLEALLRNQGHRVYALPNGEMALKAAARERPEVILLDILMPGMDGYEVCLRLKADPELADIPVIFLSALSEPLDKVRAFQAGGVDYVTKPFQPEEVEARVRTHLELIRQRQELQAQLRKVRELERLKDSLVHMLVHDLRSPLSVVGLCLEMVKDVVPASDAGLTELMAAALRGTDQISKMISLLLDIGRMEEGRMPLQLVRGNLAEAARTVVAAVGLLARGRTIAVVAPDEVPVRFDHDLVGRVFENLLGNALKFSPERSEVRLVIEVGDGQARVSIVDQGPGIPVEQQGSLFEKFGQVRSRTRNRRLGNGLGLAFCKLAVEAHEGRIGLISEPGQGSTFWFTLPLAADPA